MGKDEKIIPFDHLMISRMIYTGISRMIYAGISRMREIGKLVRQIRIKTNSS